MLEFAGLPLDQRVSYFQEVANRRGLTLLIVEKDFWVCFSLRLLFSTPALADKFIFKGGTSLSRDVSTGRKGPDRASAQSYPGTTRSASTMQHFELGNYTLAPGLAVF
jgi:hypothetical protein